MEPDTPLSVSSSVRTTKRKLEDAIRTLDGAVACSPLTTTDRPTPSKRPLLTPSVYSTLAKFGRTSKLKERSPSSSNSEPGIDVSKSAPHLAAILARSVSQSQKIQPPSLSPRPLVHPASEYRPSSIDSFLSRLATYKITTYANKPSKIDAVSAARCGWINDGKDRLLCGMCDASWVLAGREGMNKDAANALVERQRTSLIDMHKSGCPWKDRQCDPSIYRVPLRTPTAMVHELSATATSLEISLANVAIKHPLTPCQLNSLRTIIFAVASEIPVIHHDSATSTEETTRSAHPSDTAIVTALFGWVPAPTATLHRSASALFTRVGSSGPSISMPPTPSLSRTSSFSSHLRERASSPTPSASPRMSISQLSSSPDCTMTSSRKKSVRSGHISTPTASRDTPLVYCILCQRRVGLWVYSRDDVTTPSAQDGTSASALRGHSKDFDVVKEHRSYCPYITRSAVVPSADPREGAIEGWRAVLTVVQRYELGQRQRLSRYLPGHDSGSQISTELKGVEAMVAGVKTNGGQELLKYVRNLLG